PIARQVVPSPIQCEILDICGGWAASRTFTGRELHCAREGAVVHGGLHLTFEGIKDAQVDPEPGETHQRHEKDCEQCRSGAALIVQTSSVKVPGRVPLSVAYHLTSSHNARQPKGPR